MVHLLEEKITRKRLIRFCKKNHIKKLSIFGSSQREEMHEDSDIDILVESCRKCWVGRWTSVRPVI